MPLFLIVMGFGNTPIIVVVALSAFLAALSVMNATESVQRVHVAAARVMGATPWGLVKRVYLPAVMPELITGAQLAFGNARARPDLRGNADRLRQGPGPPRWRIRARSPT